MFLNWKKQNVHFVPLITHTKDGSGHGTPIKSEWEKFSLKRDNLTFLPGVNEVSDEEFEVIKHHCDDLIKSGDLEVMKIKTSTAPGRPAIVAKTLSEVPPVEARKLIANCINIDTLKEWRTDSRADIRSLIDDRIKAILKREGKEDTNTPAVDVDPDTLEPAGE